MDNKITPEMIVALNTLRAGARGAYRVSPEVREAINTLDNADFFVPIDDAEAEAEGSMGLYDSPHSPGCPPIKHRH